MLPQEYSGDVRKLIKGLSLVTLILVLFLAVLSVNAIKEFGYIGGEIYPNKTLSVTGTGEVFATPDIAQFTFTVLEEGKDVATAQDVVTGKVNKALQALKDLGIEDKDIKTIGYNAYPRYTYPQVVCVNGFCPTKERVLSGYEVSETISVKVRDTKKAGDALAKVADTGISNIGGLQFVIDDQDTLLAEARDKAIADAEHKIKQLADSLDVKIKGVVNFSESSGDDRYPVYAETNMVGMGGGGSPAVPAGENTIQVQVYITYEIK